MKRILIIENDDKMRRFLIEVLESPDYEILETDNSKEGTALALGEDLDLVVIDIKLPSKKRGIGIARAMRHNEKSCDVPIIFVTGYAHGKETTEVRNIKKHTYITKPFDVKDFIAEVERYLGDKE